MKVLISRMIDLFLFLLAVCRLQFEICALNHRSVELNLQLFHSVIQFIVGSIEASYIVLCVTHNQFAI